MEYLQGADIKPPKGFTVLLEAFCLLHASLLNQIIGSGRPKEQHFPKFYLNPRARVLPANRETNDSEKHTLYNR